MGWEIDWETGTILDLATSEVGRQVLDAKSQLEELRKKVVSQVDDYLVHATNNYTGLRTQVEAVPLAVLDHAGRWIADKISDQLSLIDSALGRASLNYRYLVDRVQERLNAQASSASATSPCPHGSISVQQFEKALEEILKQPGVCGLLGKNIPQAPGQCCTTGYATIGVSKQDIDLSVPQPFIIQDRGFWTSGECEYYVNVSAPIYFSSAECQYQAAPPAPATPKTPHPQPPPAGPVTVPFPPPQIQPLPVQIVPPQPQPAGGGPVSTTTSISPTESTQVTLSCPPPEVKVEVTCPEEKKETKEDLEKKEEEGPACKELYIEADKWDAKPEYIVSSLPEKDEQLCWEMSSLGGDFIRLVYMSAKLSGKKMRDMFSFTPNLD